MATLEGGSGRAAARVGLVVLCASLGPASFLRGGERWIRTYDETCQGRGWDEAGAMALAPSGGVYATGLARHTQYGSGEVVTLRYDASGSLLWAARPHDPGVRLGPPVAIAVGAGGNVHVAGISALDSETDLWVATYGPAGEQLWTFRWDGPSHGPDAPRALAVDSRGNILLTGVSSDSDGLQCDAVTLKISPEGTLLWSTRYASTFVREREGGGTALVEAEDDPGGLVVDSSGAVFVAGRSRPDDLGPAAIFAIAYDRDGHELWARTFDVDADRPPRVVRDRAGDLVLAATYPRDLASGSPARGLALAKLAPDGNTKWLRATGVELGMLGPIAVDPLTDPGDIIATGFRAVEGGECAELVVARLFPDGTLAWTHAIDAGSACVELGGSSDPYVGLGIDRSGTIALSCAHRSKAIVLSLDPSGSERWRDERPEPAEEAAAGRGFAVSETGDAYFLYTRLQVAAGGDMAVLKYGLGGSVAWEALWDSEGSSQEFAQRIGVDDAGNVHVVGNALACGDAFDVVAVTYDRSGNPLRVSRFEDPDGLDDRADAVAVGRSGDVHLTCLSRGPASTTPWWRLKTIAFDAGGNLAWAAPYSREGREDLVFSTAIALDATGNTIVGVVRTDGEDPPRSTELALLKYSPAGVRLWERDLAIGLEPGLAPRGVAADAAGNIYVAAYGSPAPRSGLDAKTVKLDPSGQVLWVATFEGPEGLTEISRDMALDPSGGVVVLVETPLGTGSRVYSFLRYDERGTLTRSFRLDRIEERPIGLGAIAVDPDGAVCATGSFWVTGQLAFLLTLKVGARGELAWEDRREGARGASYHGHKIAIGPAGKVVVVGGDGLHSVVTLAYGPTGELERSWVEGSPAAELVPADLAVDRSGGIVVAATGLLGHPESDLVAIRYPGADATFVRGDANGDGELGGGPTDAIFLLTYLFLGGDPPACLAACDADSSGEVELTDAVFLLNHQFLGGPSPGAPYPSCGIDPEPTIECAASTCDEDG